MKQKKVKKAKEEGTLNSIAAKCQKSKEPDISQTETVPGTAW